MKSSEITDALAQILRGMKPGSATAEQMAKEIRRELRGFGLEIGPIPPSKEAKIEAAAREHERWAADSEAAAKEYLGVGRTKMAEEAWNKAAVSRARAKVIRETGRIQP